MLQKATLSIPSCHQLSLVPQPEAGEWHTLPPPRPGCQVTGDCVAMHSCCKHMSAARLTVAMHSCSEHTNAAPLTMAMHSCSKRTSAAVLSRPEDCFHPVLPDLWLLQPFCPIFCDGPWTLRERGVTDPLTVEHCAETYILCLDPLGLLTTIHCTQSSLMRSDH